MKVFYNIFISHKYTFQADIPFLLFGLFSRINSTFSISPGGRINPEVEVEDSVLGSSYSVFFSFFPLKFKENSISIVILDVLNDSERLGMYQE